MMNPKSTDTNPTLRRTIIPVYTTRGDVDAFLVYPHLYNRMGDWIGWVTPQRDVYSVLGFYVGTLSDEPRILRKRITAALKPRLKAPAAPGKITPPATVPLAPMMRELTFSIVDVLLDEPERLHTLDTGELREEMN
jgi:hypothetical protein